MTNNIQTAEEQTDREVQQEGSKHSRTIVQTSQHVGKRSKQYHNVPFIVVCILLDDPSILEYTLFASVCCTCCCCGGCREEGTAVGDGRGEYKEEKGEAVVVLLMTAAEAELVANGSVLYEFVVDRDCCLPLLLLLVGGAVIVFEQRKEEEEEERERERDTNATNSDNNTTQQPTILYDLLYVY